MDELFENLRRFEKLLNKHAVSKGDKPQNFLEFFHQDDQVIEAQLLKWFH